MSDINRKRDDTCCDDRSIDSTDSSVIDDRTRSVTRGVGSVSPDRSAAHDRPRRNRRRRSLDDSLNESSSVVSGDHSERANIAGGAVTNDDGVSRGGR